jgi:hypothetical protein
MSKYTPSQRIVRDGYVRGLRQAFVASEGQHKEEFDRWLAAHDAEVAATALREAAEIAGKRAQESFNKGHLDSAFGSNLVRELLSARAAAIGPNLP